MSQYGISDLEHKIILSQIERRAKYREQFLRLRTDPCKHSLEAGYVFDEALQRYMSMKSTQFEFFQTTRRTVFKGISYIVIPMFSFGYLLWKQRSEFLEDCRCGRIRYRDRIFKLK